MASVSHTNDDGMVQVEAVAHSLNVTEDCGPPYVDFCDFLKGSEQRVYRTRGSRERLE